MCNVFLILTSTARLFTDSELYNQGLNPKWPKIEGRNRFWGESALARKTLKLGAGVFLGVEEALRTHVTGTNVHSFHYTNL